MSFQTSIILDKLILVGKRKNYSVPFSPGVNIIYGDADTGKSSILELISYLLGANKLSLYEEIETSVKYALLEVNLNDQPFCIKRDIFDPSRYIEVYRCKFEEIEKFSSTKYLPNFSHKANEYEYYSDFLLDALGLPKIKIKQAPAKEESRMTRFSFRDLFKYCYINQDDLGSKSLLNIGNFTLEIKNKETFKYIFNVLDGQISELQADISEKSLAKSNLDNKLKAVSEFLRNSDFDTQLNIDESLLQIDDKILEIESYIRDIKTRMISDSDVYRSLKSNHDEIIDKIKEVELEIEKSNRYMQQYVRLKNDYMLDIEKFEATVEAKESIGSHRESTSICPICNQQMIFSDVEENFEINSEEKINYEINSIKKRLKDINNFIIEQRNINDIKNLELNELLSEQERIKFHMDNYTSELITPYISERDSFISELASLVQTKKDYLYRLKIRNQQKQMKDMIISLEKSIDNLTEKLERMRKNAPSKEEILSNLSDRLNLFLKFINIKNRKDISISERTFLPKVRGLDYKDISSGGLRTITSIGYFASIIGCAKDEEINIPPFLMIDTVGKYLGKTKESYLVDTIPATDREEGMSDPSKYRNLYEYLILLSMEFEKARKNCQFILVDNDVPPEIQKDYLGFVIAHFSSEGKDGLPIGLIDDADILSNN